MARKSPKYPPIVEPNQLGCVWNFSGLFHHHRGGGHLNRKLLSDVSHGSKILTGTGHVRSQEIMLNFDEQLKAINIESNRKPTMVDRREKNVSLSKHTKKNKEVKRDSSQTSMDIRSLDEGFCTQIPWKVEKDSRLGKSPNKYEQFDDKKKNPRFVERIVVLKAAESLVDVGCGWSNLQPQNRSTSKQQIVKHTRFSFTDIRKRLKNSRKLKNAKEPCDYVCESSSKTSGPKQEPDVFVEARRHLAERLREVAKNDSFSSQKASRTLERVLLSSPKHESTASLTPKREETHMRFSPWNDSEGCFDESLRTRKENLTSHSSPTRQNGRLEITDTNDLKFSMAEGSRLGTLLDVSSPKSDSKFKLEAVDNDRFRGENPSPVSVLESFFVDNVSSPTSTVDSVEHHIQPRHLDFEEHSQTPSPPHRKTSLSSSMDTEVISGYVKKVNQASQLNWDDFLTMECPEESNCDHKLLHDCIKEVIISSHHFYFEYSPFEKSKIRPFSFEEHVVNEVMEKVNWHTLPPTIPQTLDQIVRNDIAKSGKWVDVKLNSKEIVFEVVDETLQGLIMEVIFDFRS